MLLNQLARLPWFVLLLAAWIHLRFQMFGDEPQMLNAFDSPHSLAALGVLVWRRGLATEITGLQ